MRTAWLLLMVMTLPKGAFAAIGCTLSSPAEDLRYVYPQMTSYREDSRTFRERSEFEALRRRLGGELDPIYETFETPYTVYSVFKGKEKIGIVHGVNVPGKGGVIQVFLSVDPKTAEIRRMFFQRLESPAARTLRSKEFRARFEGLTLADFYKHDYYAAREPGSAADKLGRFRPPSEDAAGKTDYEAAVRGVRKNLVLLDFFVFGRRFEPFFERARAAKQGRKS